MRYHLLSVRIAIHKKRYVVTNASEDVKKREHLHTVGGNVNWCSLEVPQKFKNRAIILSSNPLRVYPKKLKS